MRLPSFLFYFMEHFAKFVSSCGTRELRLYYEHDSENPLTDWDWNIQLYSWDKDLEFYKCDKQTIFTDESESWKDKKTGEWLDAKAIAKASVPKKAKKTELWASCPHYRAFLCWGILWTEDPDISQESLEGMAQTIREYIEGEVYGFRLFDRTKKIEVGMEDIYKENSVDLEDFEIDSCWGYYGDSGIEDIKKETCPEGQTWIEQK